MARLLVIDDDQLLNETLCDLLIRKQHSVESAYSISEALAAVDKGEFDVIFLDVLLPDGNGLDIIPALKKAESEPEIIIMTGRGDENGAEIAVQCGAWCYIEKSTITRELILPLTRVLEYRAERKSSGPSRILNRDNIIGSSEAINNCLKLVADAAVSEVNVLVEGETGTGKEIFANTIHQNSSRGRKGSFVVVDCASLPESLVESILFGHVRGAYTGADVPRKGLVTQANGGTLFLDEIGELPLSVQKSFLRVLQERRYRPVGGAAEERSDFRLIAATNRDLEKMAEEGTFRKDLLYRVRSMEITLPPLRERGKDVLELAGHFVNRFCVRYGKERKIFSPEFRDALMAYSWPGNIRELYNVLETVFATTIDNESLYTRNLPEEIQLEYVKSTLKRKRVPDEPSGREAAPVTAAEPLSSWKAYRNRTELAYMQRLLLETRGNIKEACRISGLSKARIYQLINKHNLQGS